MKHHTLILIFLLLIMSINNHCFAEVKQIEASGQNYTETYSDDVAENVIAEIYEWKAQLGCKVKLPKNWEKKIREGQLDEHVHKQRYSYRNGCYKVTDIYRFKDGDSVTVKNEFRE